MSQKKFQFKTLDAFLSPKFNLQTISMSAKRPQRLSLADFDSECSRHISSMGDLSQAAAPSAVGRNTLRPQLRSHFPPTCPRPQPRHD